MAFQNWVSNIFPIYLHREVNLIACTKVQDRARTTVWSDYIGVGSLMFYRKFHGFLFLISIEEDLKKAFYCIWAWRPSWSMNQNHLNKFTSSLSTSLSCEILLKYAQCFQMSMENGNSLNLQKEVECHRFTLRSYVSMLLVNMVSLCNMIYQSLIVLSIFPIYMNRVVYSTLRTEVKGQPKAIIWTSLVGLESLVICVKFQDFTNESSQIHLEEI